MLLLLVMVSLSFSNASFSSAPHLNFVSLCVSSHNGAVSDEYLGINFDRYPVMPRMILTASFEELVVALFHIQLGEDGAFMELVHEIFYNSALDYPVSFHKFVGYPEVHAGSDHVWFQVFLV